MSAYIVSRNHIAELVSAAVYHHRAPRSCGFGWRFRGAWRELEGDYGHPITGEAISAPSYLGEVLWRENVRSVKARYRGSEDLPGPIDQSWREGYGKHVQAPFPTELPTRGRIRLLAALRCYDYQSCETSDYHETEAHAVVEALREAIISELIDSNLPPEERWSID